jgi:quercetin dioxygenase-like cupin family protein
VEIFPFDRGEVAVDRFGSRRVHATGVASAEAGGVRLTCLNVAPGGTIGAHRAVVHQVFLVVAGEGWVAGEDGVRTPVRAGTAVYWAPGEVHTSGTGTGFTALALEGESTVPVRPAAPGRPDDTGGPDDPGRRA